MAKKTLHMIFTIIASAVLVWPATSPATPEPVEWLSHPDGEIHYYDIIECTNISWYEAKDQAESLVFNGMHGHLTTIPFEAENTFIVDHVLVNAQSGTYFIGGLQSPFPGGDWQWITGEEWSYSNWWVTEPSGDGPALVIYSSLATLEKLGRWNDLPGDLQLQNAGYIVEYSAPSPGEWILLDGQLNVPRDGLTGEYANGYLWAFGGCVSPCSPSNAQNALSRYDPITDTWQLMSPMITARHSLGSAVIGNYIYAVGGHVANSISACQRYNFYTDTWEALASMPQGRSGPGVAAFNGEIYVFGGNSYGTYQSTFLIYDPVVDSWRTGGNMPVAAQPWRAVTMGDKIYVGTHVTSNYSLWIYDPVNETWSETPSMNTQRWNNELVSIEGRIYAIGGSSASGYLSSVESWAPGETRWRVEPSMNMTRMQFGSAAIGNEIYVFGGWDGSNNLASTEMLAVGEVPPPPPPPPVEADWFVDDDAPNDPGKGDPDVSDPAEDGSVEHPFDTIQEAIDVASEGQDIAVLPGVYHGEVVFEGKPITVRGVATQQGIAVLENPGDFGVSFYWGEGPESRLSNVIIRNSDHGIFIAGSSPTIANVTVVGNMIGIGAYGQSQPDISNSIFWGNVEDDLFGCEARHSCIQFSEGDGGISLDPEFVNFGDYHLRSERGRYWPEHNVWVLDNVTSPCIDGGDPAIHPGAEPMPNGGRINMGAYGGTPYASMSEWQPRSDLNHDGIVDFMDVAIMAMDWLEYAGWFNH